MEYEASTGSVRRAFDKFSLEAGRFAGDVELFLARLGDAEKLLGLTAFILVLMFLVVRRPTNQKESGSMGRQFALALVIVVIFSFGVGWMFDGRFDVPDVFGS
jgi:hypothetical protein